MCEATRQCIQLHAFRCLQLFAVLPGQQYSVVCFGRLILSFTNRAITLRRLALFYKDVDHMLNGMTCSKAKQSNMLWSFLKSCSHKQSKQGLAVSGMRQIDGSSSNAIMLRFLFKCTCNMYPKLPSSSSWLPGSGPDKCIISTLAAFSGLAHYS